MGHSCCWTHSGSQSEGWHRRPPCEWVFFCPHPLCPSAVLACWSYWSWGSLGMRLASQCRRISLAHVSAPSCRCRPICSTSAAWSYFTQVLSGEPEVVLRIARFSSWLVFALPETACELRNWQSPLRVGLSWNSSLLHWTSHLILPHHRTSPFHLLLIVQ